LRGEGGSNSRTGTAVYDAREWYNEKVKIASNRRRSRKNDELSSWSSVSITSMALPAKTTPLEH